MGFSFKTGDIGSNLPATAKSCNCYFYDEGATTLLESLSGFRAPHLPMS